MSAGIIGHASRDENKKASGGKVGDQDKLEVCTRTWYDGKWNYVLRPKTTELAEKSARFVEDVCEGDMVGYDQGGRNTLYREAKAVNFDGTKIKNKCESDCSSFMHVAAIAGGANLAYGSNGLTTRTMVNAFKKSGDYEVLSNKKYRTSDKYLRRGDILVREGSHTAMALTDGAEAYEKVQIDNKTYTVVKGDTLSKIGKKTGIAWKTIAKINGIKAPYIIHTGQVLKLINDETTVPFKVKLKTNLNIRNKANGKIVQAGGAKKNCIYTIIEVDGTWGKLKSGTEWISIKDEYVDII